MVRRAGLVVLSCLLVLAVPDGVLSAAPCWRPPVSGVVTDPFRAPACPYCAGNRGLEYRVGSAATVSAVAAGEVTWAGLVAGTRYVVVRLPSGWRLTYGRLTSTSLRQGDRVVRGATIGVASGTFHFGLRIDDRYADPAPFLGRMVGRPRLVPVDGARPHPAPPARLRCGV